MNNDPSLMASKSTRGIDRFLTGRNIAALAVCGSALLASCNPFNNDDNDSPELNVGGSTIEATCDAPATPVTDYRAEYGFPGVFASNEAISAEKVDNQLVVEEAVAENAQNTLGLSYIKAFMNSNGSVQVNDIFGQAQEIFDNAINDPELQKELCASVSEELLRNGIVDTVTSPTVTIRTSEYDENGALIGVIPSEGNSQTPTKALYITDASGAPLAGISLEKENNGAFLVFEKIGDQSGAETPDSTPDTAPVSTIVDENGEPIPVTVMETPDGTKITVINTPEGPIAVNPETGEPTGVPVPPGSTEIPSGGSGGQPEGSGPSHAGPGTSQPGTVDTEPGVTSGPTTTEGTGTVPTGTTPTGTTPGTTTVVTSAPTTLPPITVVVTTAPTTTPPTTTVPATTTTTTTHIVDLCPNIPGTQNPVPPTQEIVIIDGEPFCKDKRVTATTVAGNPAP